MSDEFVLNVLEHITLAQVLLIISALSVMFLFVKQAFPSLKKMIKIIDSLTGLPEFMEQAAQTDKAQAELLERLRAQVENDHEENLRDELTRIGVCVTTIAEKIQERESGK